MKTKREELMWQMGKHNKTGELVFVARHPDDEDDICVMTAFCCFLQPLSEPEKIIWYLIYDEQYLANKPYFVGSVEYISSWLSLTIRQTYRYLQRMIENGHIRRVDDVPNAYQIVEDDPMYLEALAFQKDPQLASEKWEAEIKAKRAAKKAAKQSVTSD